MSQKREKPQGDVHESLENENGGFEERLKMMERLASFSCRPNSWSYHPCHSELQNCHYEPQNYKNATLGLKC